MSINPETQRSIRRIRDETNRAVDEVELALIKSWVSAWDTIAKDLGVAVESLVASNVDGVVSATAVRRHQMLADALRLAEDTISALVREAGGTVARSANGFVVSGMNGNVEIIRTQLPANTDGAGLVFDRIPAQAIEAMVTRYTTRIVSGYLPLADDVIASLRSELLRGIIVGDNPRRVASRIMTAAEGRFNGGRARALNIARTELLDAHRAAARAADRANRDVLRGWMWWAKLDAKTCPSCAAQHGSEYEVDDDGPLDHHSGRCTGVPLTKSWADLGFSGMDEPAPEKVTAEDWFDNLTEDTQKSMLGKSRYDAWAAGEYPMSDWSVRRENTGWRDSYNTSPVPGRS